MASKLALFPLQSVVYPGEDLPLHIFEKRYKQLMDDCENTGINFGIPIYIDNQLDYGTEMELVRVVQKYDNGTRDVICRGLRVFRIKKFRIHEEGKFYAGGEVQFFNDIDDSTETLKGQLIELIHELYLHLELPGPKIDVSSFRSFTLAHKIGLSLDQEYSLLKLFSERARQEFLINHLLITIPIVQEMNRTKQTIELNGHFRNYDPLDFKEFRLRTKN